MRDNATANGLRLLLMAIVLIVAMGTIAAALVHAGPWLGALLPH
jgi:hypothetical protein